MIFKYWHEGNGAGHPEEYYYVDTVDFRRSRLSDENIWELGQTKIASRREIELMVGEIIRMRTEARSMLESCKRRNSEGGWISSGWVEGNLEEMLGYESLFGRENWCQESSFHNASSVEPTSESSPVESVESSPAQNASVYKQIRAFTRRRS